MGAHDIQQIPSPTFLRRVHHRTAVLKDHGDLTAAQVSPLFAVIGKQILSLKRNALPRKPLPPPARSPRTARITVVFPLPDSPTSDTICPCFISRLKFCNGRYILIGNRSHFSTVTYLPYLPSLLVFRIQDIPERISQHIKDYNYNKNCQTRGKSSSMVQTEYMLFLHLAYSPIPVPAALLRIPGRT